MTGPERGFLLLTSRLGDPDRRVLSSAQFRVLADRAGHAKSPREDRELTEGDLLALGYGREMAGRIVQLLSEEARLDRYIKRGQRLDCVPVTWGSEGYPLRLKQQLGSDSPGCLWAKGDLSLLSRPAVALVGSRELRPENRAFAEAVGRQAARQGFVLVSGNARGADKAAQEACLEAGGQVISIVADELWKHPKRRNLLYLSEDDFAAGFSAQRALSRNRCIHALGQVAFVAQAELHKGGTWDGTVKNLRFGWSTAACFRDGSQAMEQLAQMGASLVDIPDLRDFSSLEQQKMAMF